MTMTVTDIPIAIIAPGTIPKDLVKGLEDWEFGVQEDIIQTTVFLQSARILRRLQEI